ncbi:MULTISPECIES: YggT family protein [Priestia]|uniref:YggT family protein n=1 Tax=Priestia TaxID=2800373 RepID=UPI001F13A9DE|nr:MULTISPECIES: YggT family protein [Priestia]MCU7708148.1 YggT family protein [Priestia megaterium]MCW1047774.1 YggT family protein [Priestia sp. JV24]MDH3185134.1 YggT family protein [Priestia megaterium]UMZ32251.1 YggT family protein [Priestia megaterium]
MHIVFGILGQLIGLYSWALIIYILMSWVPDVRASKFGQLLGSICEPYLEPFRKIIPPIGMIDISPLVAIFLLRFAERGVYSLNNVVGFI